LTGGLSFTRSRGSLADLYKGHDNGIGLLRLILAVAVVFSHSKPLGFGQQDLGYYLFDRQTNVGTLAVYGFFVLSGMLITRSARRSSLGRYAWHRGLRIMPALWVCLLVSALVLAPLVTLREVGNLDGFWSGPNGPFDYFRANMWTGLRQFGIHEIFEHTTPYGRHTSTSVFDGALWSLSYEMLCYVIFGLLAITGVLANARRFVLFSAVALYGIIIWDYTVSGSFGGPVAADHGSVTTPLLGLMSMHWLIYLGFLFFLGAVFELYRERIPIHDGLGVLAGLVFLATLLAGGFFAFGFAAYAYLLLWLAIRMPRQLHWVGRKNDYSYGIYIYGFLMQQLFASLGYNRWGYLPFALLSLAAAVACAWLSWHLIERHALHLKGWTPHLPRRRRAPEAAETPAEPDQKKGEPDQKKGEEATEPEPAATKA
jgi:peptidoglycan/LPS O-acetylase OafA/YrhL